MKITKSQLIKIIKEELNEYGNYSAAAGVDIRAAQLAGGGNAVQSGEEAELTLGGLVGELRTLLQEWEEKEYPSDEARYEGYFDDILQVTERYDPCAHPGESCEESHPDQSHGECIMQNEEGEEELEEANRTAKGNVTQDAREKYATVGKDKFPIFDPKSAKAAIKLRGHTSKANQKKIINKAAKYAPAAAKKARKADKKD